MAQTFKKGDRVVRTGFSFSGVEHGEIYTVNRQSDNALYLEGFDQAYKPTRFELFNPAAIKPEGAYNPNIGHASDGSGLQKHSIGGPFPFVVVGIDNPTGLEPGLYWYVQDKTGRRCTAHLKDSQRILNAAEFLAETYPNGISPHATPPLSDSDGYIPPAPPVQPTITVELTAGEHDLLRALLSHTTGDCDAVLNLLAKFGGYDKEVTARFETTFTTYGGEFAGSGPRGSIHLVRKD